jgi:mannose-6-phosphate isomerase-like protein (cupin superfamily)
MVRMRNLLIAAALAAGFTWAADNKVDATFLRRHISDVAFVKNEFTTESCRYRPLFGAGDGESAVAHGVSRYGEITVDAGGACKDLRYGYEEQVYVILEGAGRLQYGSDSAAVKKNDFMYLPAGIVRGISNPGSSALRLLVAGFRLKSAPPAPPKLLIDNIDDVPTETVEGHPDTVLYRLLMGDTTSTRDRIAAGHLLVSLYVMEFKPGGDNKPHHHDNEEEIYLLLDGQGEMVAGGGMDGVEGRHPARPGDAYFFRLNCTVGFYNGSHGTSRILAMRSTYPRGGR